LKKKGAKEKLKKRQPRPKKNEMKDNNNNLRGDEFSDPVSHFVTFG